MFSPPANSCSFPYSKNARLMYCSSSSLTDLKANHITSNLKHALVKYFNLQLCRPKLDRDGDYDFGF
jgi:hypothetical protein